MDPTIIAAITGILGVILGAVIGGVFALKATKRQVEVMLLQSRGDVNERAAHAGRMVHGPPISRDRSRARGPSPYDRW